MTADEATYIFNYYSRLMTLNEKVAFRHLGGTMKVTLGRSDGVAQEQVKQGSTYFRKWLSDDPEVLLLTREGYDAFVLQTAQRIMNDNQSLVFLNHCPQCGGLARTPAAKQCRFCGHDWHMRTMG